MALEISVGEKEIKAAGLDPNAPPDLIVHIRGPIFTVKLNARKTLDNNIIIYDNRFFNIVLIPFKNKIIAMPKQTVNRDTYAMQNDFLTFLQDKGALVFELDADACFAAVVPVATTISKFPATRRDIAVIVKDEVPSSRLLEAAESASPELVRSVRIFDVYKGPGIEAGLKSVALGLILQQTSRTLTDEDADTVMSAVLRKLQQDFGAELRD
ncbi:MAG: hypothetical protein P8M18_04085 [Woeseiaceae bacterium]|nr:hypothetical protein [Woeseiaceae bacterium]